MLVGLFLLYLAAFIAVLFSIQWVVGVLSGITAGNSSEFIVAVGGMAAIAVLIRYNLGGIVIAVAIMVFWALLLFGTGSMYVTATLTIAAGALYTAAAATIVKALLRV